MMLVHEVFERGKERNGNNTYLNFEGNEFTYNEFADRINRAANALRELGIKKNDRVGTVIPNCPEHVELVFACSKIGAVFTPNNPELERDALSYTFGLSEPDVVITTSDLDDKVSDALTGDTLNEILTLESFRSRREEQSASIESVEVTDQHPIAHIYTSGTTGMPKACEIPHETWTEAAIYFTDRIGFAPTDNIACAHPLYHAIWWTVCLTAPSVGATAVIFERFSSSNWWDWMRENDVSAAITVGGLLEMLENLPENENDADNPVDRIYTKSVRPDFEERFDVRLVSGYGLTESPYVSMNPVDPDRRKEDSIGYPNAKKQMKIVDDDGNEVPRGEVGEIIINSPFVFDGYYSEPEKTEEAFEDDWFYTGDLGKRDEEGFFYYVDRKKDIIRRSGENIAPEEIEKVINQLPDVENVAVIPSPDEVRGEEIKAIVKAKPGAELTPEEIVAACREPLGEFKWPRYVEFVDELPTSDSTQRLQKNVLKEREKEEDPDHWDRKEHTS